MELFPRTVPTGLKHGTVTVRTEDGPVEVTTFRREAGYADGRHPDAVDFDATLAEDLAGGISPSTPWPWMKTAW